MKQLKPGQICTINGHRLQCQKGSCSICKEQYQMDCLLTALGIGAAVSQCIAFFGRENHPVFIEKKVTLLQAIQNKPKQNIPGL